MLVKDDLDLLFCILSEVLFRDQAQCHLAENAFRYRR